MVAGCCTPHTSAPIAIVDPNAATAARPVFTVTAGTIGLSVGYEIDAREPQSMPP